MEADVLYLWRGDEVQEAVTLDSDEGHLVRLDPETQATVGCTIFDFCRRWQKAGATTTLTVTVPSLGFGSEAYEAQTHELVSA